MTPAAEIQAAAFQNRTADPKPLAAQTLNDVYTYRKTKVKRLKCPHRRTWARMGRGLASRSADSRRATLRPTPRLTTHTPPHIFFQAEAKFGPSAVCKAIDKCNDPLVQAARVLSVKDQQLSSYLSIYNDNMANNALLTAVSSSLQVTPKPINQNNANNIAVGCTQGPVTDYYSGQGYDAIDFTSKYTQWISVGMTDENTDACQQSEDVGPSCATVCSRRIMTCNPCAMKAATTSFAALMWALTQAGNSVTASACAADYATKAGFPLTDNPKDQVLAFLNSPAASAPFVPSNSYAGWNGELCGTLPEDNFRLYFCNPPNYDLVAQKYGYTDPCQVPSWTRDYTTFKTDSFPGATSGALCFCERTLPGI